MPKLRKWEETQLIEACKKSTSMAQILRKLGLHPTGGNYAQLKKYMGELNLSLRNVNGQGQGWRKGSTKPIAKAVPIEMFLVKNRLCRSSSLKKRLLKEGFMRRECNNCKLTKWLNNDIPLHLDHINGDKFDNCIENLRLLCPNCHALTPTYAGKNIGKNKPKKVKTVTQELLEKGLLIQTSPKSLPRKPREPNPACLHCGNLVKRLKSKYCSYKCSHIVQRKIKWPTKKELERLITQKSILNIGKMYGVSDNAVRKWMKHYNISKTKNLTIKTECGSVKI